MQWIEEVLLAFSDMMDYAWDIDPVRWFLKGISFMLAILVVILCIYGVTRYFDDVESNNWMGHIASVILSVIVAMVIGSVVDDVI